MGVQALLQRALHTLRRDPVFLVVLGLAGAAVFGDVEKRLDRIGDHITEQHAFPAEVARGAAGGLDQRGFIAQEAFLVRVEDANE